MYKLNEKAAFFRIGLQVGVFTVDAVIDWIDSEIASAESPQDLLLDLTLMKASNPKDVLSKLQRLSSGADNMLALRRVLGEMYPLLQSNSKYGPTFAKGLYEIFVEFDYDVPEDLTAICAIDDDYSMAIQGTFGTEKAANEGFLDFLEPFFDKYGSANKALHQTFKTADR